MPEGCFSLSLLLILLAVLVFTLAGCVLYSGLLTVITVQTSSSSLKKTTFAYKFKEGAYKNSGQLLKEARLVGATGLSCIGVFYDEPKQVNI